MSRMVYLRNGQQSCYASVGRKIECTGSGQDEEFKRRCALPSPCFKTDWAWALYLNKGAVAVFLHSDCIREVPNKTGRGISRLY